MICLAMETASLIGIANAWVLACPDWNVNPEEAAVSTPITCPAVLTSGPPESPG